MKKKTNKINVFQIIAAVLTAVLVINVSVCVFAFYEHNKKDPVDTDSFVYALKNQSYYHLMRQCYSLDMDEIEKDSEVYEYYCIAKYFENASLYKTYLGYDDEKSNEYKENMDEYSQGIVKLNYTIAEIKEIFEIE